MADRPPPLWTGTLTRDGNVLRGVVHDRWQWPVEIVITKDEAGNYLCEGFLGETPEHLRLPIEGPMRNPLPL